MKDEKEEEPNEPELEFDGTTVLCRVCGDKASGFHYGVHSCEGCKGFFRRSIQQKIQYRPCTKNQQCSILRINRNRCQYCRLKKCIAVGMSRDAVRFGRVPKREKAKILAEMQRVNARSRENALATELEDDNKLIATIIQAHAETCEYTRDKITPLLENARQNPVFMLCPPQMACPLNPNPQPLHSKTRILEDFSERFSPAIRGVVEFAKRIPGFNLLPQENQVTLLKAGVFEVLLVRLACMFDSVTDTMLCLNGQVIKRENLHSASNARFLMDSMFDFAERLNSLNLNDNALALFCAAVVIAPDRPGLRNVEFIERMHSKLMQALQQTVITSHPESPGVFAELVKKIPDLRTLNTLHSEKLLAFKMDPSEMNGKMCSTTTTTIDDLHDYSNLYQIPAQPTEGYHSMWVEEWKHLQEANSDSLGQHGNVLNEWIGDCKTVIQVNSDTDSPHSVELTSTSSGDTCDQKSPISPLSKGQISSDSESICSGEIAQLTDLKISKCQDRSDRSNSGSCSENEDHYPNQVKGKLELNSDSGVESGKELSSSSRPPSFELAHSPSEKCSTSDSENSNVSKPEPPEKDMPVLKRALQAPPLVRTLYIYDDTYKPHKKFRAFRRDSSENGDTSPTLRIMRNVEGPRLGESQLKRMDIINNIIMKTENSNTRPAEAVIQRETTGCVFPSASLPQITTQNFINANMMPKGQMVCAPYYIPQPIMTNNITYPTTTWTLVPTNVNDMTARLAMHASPQVVTGTPTPITFAPRPLMPPASPGLQSPPPTRMYYDPRTPTSVMMMCPNNFNGLQAHGKTLQVPNSPSAPQSMETPDEVGEPLNLSKRIQSMTEAIPESNLMGIHVKVEPI